MTTVSLANPSLVPIEAITTMGISVKEGENPIGFFGTGLKYAIASLLRTGHKITIFRGLERYDFTAETDTVRGKEFTFIRMEMDSPIMESGRTSTRLGFTTHLGAKWKMWQVFRELYSNCLDEAGEISFSPVAPQEGWTVVRVSGEEFAKAAVERDRYFLSSPPVYHGSLVDIHEGSTQGVYYRGVLTNRLEARAAHTYNLTTQMDLTEDRTLKDAYMVDYYIAHAVSNCDRPEIVEPILLNVGGYEATLPLANPSAGFARIVLDLCERRGVGAVLPQAVKIAETWAQREAPVKLLELSAREASEIETAKTFLAQIGFPVEHPIIVTETLGPDIFGMAKDGKIYLSRVTLARGGNFLIGTILEERLHLTDGFHDESRRFQDFLVDLVVKFARDALFHREAA